ncbi:MAG: hypothetical protein Aurels2KO_43510 [Aureliella sp.]
MQVKVRFKHRRIYMLALVPILIASWLMIHRLPVSRGSHLAATVDSRIATWGTVHWGVDRTFGVEVDDGHCRKTVPSDRARPPTPADLTKDLSYTAKYPENAVAVGTMWVVAVSDSQELLLFDMETLQQVDKRTTLAGNDLRVVNVEGSSNILCSEYSTNTPTGKGATVTRTLLTIADGKFKELERWKSDWHFAYSAVGPNIFTLKNSMTNPAAPSIVERRDVDGKVVDEIQLPEDFRTASDILFVGDIVFGSPGSNRPIPYDLIAKRQLNLETSSTTWPLAAGDRQVLLYDSRPEARIRIYDLEPEAVVSESSFSSDAVLLAVQPERVLVGTNENGLTLYVLGRNSRTIHKQSPFAWAAWLMPVTVIAFIAWALLWIRASIRDGGAAWLDALILCGLPFVAIYFRAHSVTPQHLTLNICQGILLGSLIGSACWVAFGNSRHAFRILPFFGSACLLCVALLWYLGVTRLGVEGLVTTALPATGFLFVGLALRAFGCRCVNIHDADSAAEKPQVTMLDYFALVLGLAIFLAPARLFAAEMDLLSMLRSIWLHVLVASIGLGVFVWLVMSNYRGMFVTTAFFVAVTTSLMVYIPWHHFVFASYPTSHEAARSIIVVLGFCCTTTFAILLPFRLRGWRLSFP